MGAENQQAKIVLKRCDLCQKVVKSLLFKKGDLYDHYICLDNLESQEFHVFKVKTIKQVRIEAVENGLRPFANAAVTYGMMHMLSAPHHPQHIPGNHPNTPDAPGDQQVVGLFGGADGQTGTDFPQPDMMDVSTFSGDTLHPDGDFLSTILDFLSDSGIIG